MARASKSFGCSEMILYYEISSKMEVKMYNIPTTVTKSQTMNVKADEKFKKQYGQQGLVLALHALVNAIVI